MGPQRRLETLRGHHLDNVAGRDILLGRLDHRHVTLAGLVGDEIDVAVEDGRALQMRRPGGSVEARDEFVDLRRRGAIGGAGRGMSSSATLATILSV